MGRQSAVDLALGPCVCSYLARAGSCSSRRTRSTLHALELRSKRDPSWCARQPTYTATSGVYLHNHGNFNRSGDASDGANSDHLSLWWSGLRCTRRATVWTERAWRNPESGRSDGTEYSGHNDAGHDHACLLGLSRAMVLLGNTIQSIQETECFDLWQRM